MKDDRQLVLFVDDFELVYRRWPEKRFNKRNKKWGLVWHIAYYVKQNFENKPFILHGPYPHKDIAAHTLTILQGE